MVPHVERLNGGLPLLKRIASHPWESRVTFNPACILVQDRDSLDRIIPRLPFSSTIKRQLEQEEALCFLIYRAQGRRTPEWDYTASSLGLAVLTPDLKLLARHESPILVPQYEFENLGLEDARLTKVEERFVLLYTAYGRRSLRNSIRIAMASSEDLVHWEKHGLVHADFNAVDNKNAMLFERTAGGKYLMLHRPMEGEHAMTIHWAEADDPFGTWRSRGLLMKALPNPAFAETWVGGGAPPLWLGDTRYLMLYHIGNRRAGGEREYDLGIAIVDAEGDQPIVRRDEPLLRPETVYETLGDEELGVNNVVFICGAYFHHGDLYFPYAGADSVVLGGRVGRAELETYLAGTG